MDVNDKEIAAMSSIASALDQFEEDEADKVQRIIRWASDRYQVKVTGRLDTRGKYSDRTGDEADKVGFETVGDLFHASNSKTESEKALVVGYWIMISENKAEFTSQEVNKHLKNLGHGVGNITDAFNSLKGRKPALAIQTVKSGKSRQARKKYKLTEAGIDEVKRMLQGYNEESR